MKTRILFFTMIAAALSFSCQKAELENNDVVDNGTNNEIVDFVPGPGRILAVSPTGPDTKIAFGTANEDGSLPVVWTDTDAIKVYSENCINGEEYTFGGEGENTSSAVFTGNPVEGEKRYAIFPATRALTVEDAKIKVDFGALQKQTFHSNVESNTSNLKYMPMWASEGNPGEFNFNNLCGAVSFRFNDYQEMRDMKIISVKITSSSKSIIGIGTFDVDGKKLTLEDNPSTDGADNEIEVVRAAGLAIKNINNTPQTTDEGTKGFIIALPIGIYPPNDLTVTITDSYGRVYTRTITSELEVLAGKDRTFPTLSFTFAYGDANSIIVKPEETVTFDAALRYTFANDFLAANMVKVTNAEGSDFVEEGLKVEVLWEIAEAGTALTEGAVISTPILDGNKITVTAKNGRGNALVVLKDANDVILWSWHIWVVGEELKDQTFSNATGTPTFLNMNLGATNNTIKSTDAVGLYYQYGRKDPFVISKSIKRAANSPYLTGEELTSIEQRNDSPYENARISWSIKNPNVRIVRSASTQTAKSSRCFGDWCVAENDSYRFWGSSDIASKSIFDPCPKGYCVPTGKELAELEKGVHISTAGVLLAASTSIVPTEANFDSETMAYFPYSGALLQGTVSSQTPDNRTANTIMFGWRGWYWTRLVNVATERKDVNVFVNNEGNLWGDTSTRASANNIRCMKIQ